MKKFNRFVVLIYIQSLFTSRNTANHILIQRLQKYDNDTIGAIGLKMILRLIANNLFKYSDMLFKYSNLLNVSHKLSINV